MPVGDLIHVTLHAFVLDYEEKTMERVATRGISLLILSLGIQGCGNNIFKGTEQGDPAEDATIALEQDKPSQAIQDLESALADDPDNAKYLSILAAAYAQRAGVDPIIFARKMAELSMDSSTASGRLALFTILPVPTEEVLSDIDKAISILGELGTERFLPGDSLKLGLYQSASFLLRTKVLDKNLDGTISPAEAMEMSSASAATILNQLTRAAGTLTNQATTDTTASQAATALQQYQTEIDAQPGATQDEKLRNFLATYGG